MVLCGCGMNGMTTTQRVVQFEPGRTRSYNATTKIKEVHFVGGATNG